MAPWCLIIHSPFLRAFVCVIYIQRLKNYFILNFLLVSVYVCQYRCPRKLEEGFGSLGVRLTGSCKLPDMAARSETWVKNKQVFH